MSELRSAEALQPTWLRAATAVAEVSSIFAGKTQALVEQAVAGTRAALQDDQLPSIFVAMLIPASMLALAFALWRFTSDIGWTGAFPIQTGFFSHWQVWLALAGALKFGVPALQRRVRAISKTS